MVLNSAKNLIHFSIITEFNLNQIDLMRFTGFDFV